MAKMDRFTWFYGFFTLVLLGFAVFITFLLQDVPVRLAVVNSGVEMVHLRANGPLLNAFMKDENLKIDVVGKDVYIRPEKPFEAGTTQDLAFKQVENRFGDVFEDLRVSVLIPAEEVFYMTKENRLASYNVQTKQTKIHTSEGFLVNEYVVSDQNVYLLGIKQDRVPEHEWEIPELQSLYRWDRVENVLEEEVSADIWQMRGLSLSADGQILGLYKKRPSSFLPPQLWLYDTAKKSWKQYWNTDFGAGERVIFSPDSTWLLGVDISTQGYGLSPITQGPEPKPIGNFFLPLGISPSGKFLAFQNYREEDIFTGEVYLVVFDQNGNSKELDLSGIQPEIVVFDPKKDILWFTFKDAEGITQMGWYSLDNDDWAVVDGFKEPQEVLSLQKMPYTDEIVYGIRQQNLDLAYDPENGVSSLLDAYFNDKNEPKFVLKRYDLIENKAFEIGEGFLGK